MAHANLSLSLFLSLKLHHHAYCIIFLFIYIIYLKNSVSFLKFFTVPISFNLVIFLSKSIIYPIILILLYFCHNFLIQHRIFFNSYLFIYLFQPLQSFSIIFRINTTSISSNPCFSIHLNG